MAFTPATKYSLEFIEICFTDFARGQTLAGLSVAKGVPYDTLRGWSSRYRWKLRRDAIAGRIDRTLSPSQVIIPAIVTQHLHEEADKARLQDSVSTSQEEKKPVTQSHIKPETFEGQQTQAHARLATESLRFIEAIESCPTDLLIARADKVSKLASEARKSLSLEEAKPLVVVNVGLLHALSERRRAKQLAISHPPALQDVVIDV